MDVRERTLAGRYRIEEVIGRGGMSTVYRARDEVLGRDVAVKILLPVLVEQDPTYAARFEREARSTAALASSSVVTVFDTGEDEEGGRYIVMEYVAGHSLAELLADGRPLEIHEAIRIAERVADALVAAHAAGIFHRDIKPANVMVADDGTVKVLDFGIARRIDATSITQAASVVGTAAYMAPERALGQAGDERADIYSLGCLLYVMLTGRPPFTGEIAAAVLHQQVNADAVPPSGLRKGLPAAVDALVLATLAKAPEARPKTATEVRDRLLGLAGIGATAGATAATAPLATAATRRLITQRRPAALAAVLGDHRWRAVVMGLATALVALVAVALLTGGGSPAPKKPRSTPTTAIRQTTTPTTSSVKATKPTPPAAGPIAAPGPPRHRGKPKHHHGNGGGDGGDGG